MVQAEQNIKSIRQYIAIGIMALALIAVSSILSLIAIMLSITHASASVHTNSMVVGTKVVISDNVTKIKGNEFAECKTIKRIIVSKNNKFFCTDKKGVLYNKKKTRLILCPRNLTGSYKVPEGVKSIAGNAFRYCKQLKKVTLPNSVEQIGTSAFEACTGLKKIKFSKNTKIIGIKAFYQCKQLQKIVIPNKVERICRKAFWYCNSLQSVTIPDSVENMKGNVFGGCTNLEKIIVEEGNKRYFTDENGVLFSKKKTRLMACPGKLSGTYIIPSTVKSIGSSAFYECANLTDIKLPEELKYIDYDAFVGCASLIEMEIPQKVQEIYGGSFNGCSNLKKFLVAEGNELFSSDEQGVLYYYNKTLLIKCPEGYTGIYNMPASVRTLDSSAFKGVEDISRVIVDPMNTEFYVDEKGALYKKSGRKLIYKPRK